MPHLKRAGGGAIVITSSINGTRTFTSPDATAYSCTKAAQVAMAQMLALELAKQGLEPFHRVLSLVRGKSSLPSPRWRSRKTGGASPDQQDRDADQQDRGENCYGEDKKDGTALAPDDLKVRPDGELEVDLIRRYRRSGRLVVGPRNERAGSG